ncbi:MAG TPA: sensor histidine kinase [Terriglobales bacterium]|nr:sensor histidine kinase [Terriglobales bacterium]
MQFEALAEFLRAHAARILEDWCRVVRAESAPAYRHDLHGDELLDHLPSLLLILANNLCSDESPQLRKDGEEHGAQRRGHGYTVAEILEEMQVFRQVLMAAVEKFQIANSQIDPIEMAHARLRLVDLIDLSSGASIDRYARDAEAERDAAYAQIELRNQQLTAANEHKDRFLTVLSHELRNPLSAIIAAADTIERMVPADAMIAKPRAIIQRQARHVAHLVDELLDVSRIAYGKIELRPQLVPLQDPIKFAVESTRAEIEANGIKLQVDLPAEPLYVHGDPKRLTQVVSNLLTNARKFTPANGCIKVRLAVEKHQATLRVRDTGIGISAEMLPRIFELFTQADTSLRRRSAGLGIGLTLAKNLIEMQGGHISAHSDGLGQGAEFTICLPLVQLGN